MSNYSSPRVATTPPVAIATLEPVEADVDWPEEIPITDPPRVAATLTPEQEPTPQTALVDATRPIEEAQSLLPPVGIALSVDHVRVSENTYAFRLRWSNPVGVSPKRPAIYFQWVHKTVFDMITEDKAAYGNFKQQVIAEFTKQQEAV
jgi:hypothetical protein